MKSIDRLKFHLSDGALRKWSMWNEPEFPKWGDNQERYDFFQAMKRSDTMPSGSTADFIYLPNEFEYWPYWLVLDLYIHVLAESPFADGALLAEPETLLDSVCDVLDERYSNGESQVRPPV